MDRNFSSKINFLKIVILFYASGLVPFHESSPQKAIATQSKCTTHLCIFQSFFDHFKHSHNLLCTVDHMLRTILFFHITGNAHGRKHPLQIHAKTPGSEIRTGGSNYDGRSIRRSVFCGASFHPGRESQDPLQRWMSEPHRFQTVCG